MAHANSGHARKRWRVTFKLPILHHQHSQRPIFLDSNEYVFEVLGHDTGVAAARAFKLLRKQPELKGAIIRDCFITVKFLEYFTKRDEAIQQGVPEGSTSGPMNPEPEETDHE